MKTRRQYHESSKQFELEAKVIELTEHDGHTAAVLDRTVFYPTGGGQPHDTGVLGGMSVVDVVTRPEDKAVLHVLGEALEDGASLYVGMQVWGMVDHDRRLDHMQQHSGQHLLSQAFERVAGRSTVGFHLGKETCTIDVDGGPVDAGMLRSVEELANRVVFTNRCIRIHRVGHDELKKLPIRRETYSGDDVRVIEIEGFDFSTCGGTHVERTGEIGLIAILGTERVRDAVRVEFVCGGRALREFRETNTVCREVGRTLSTSREAIVGKVASLREEARHQRKRLQELNRLAAEVEATELLQAAEPVGEIQVVRQTFTGRSLDEVRVLAHQVCRKEGVVVLFGLEDRGRARLVFARSKDVEEPMGPLMARTATAYGGRGGGSAAAGQGAIADAGRLAESLQAARQWLQRD